MLTSGSFGPKNCSEEMDLALPNLSWALVEVSISNVFRLRLGLKVGQIEGTENHFRNIGNRLKWKCIWEWTRLSLISSYKIDWTDYRN